MNFEIKLLKDDVLDAKLKKDGYIVIPFLNAHEVAGLNNYYKERFQPPLANTPVFNSMRIEDAELRAQTLQKIKDVFSRAASETFFECRVFGGSLMAKAQGEEGIVEPHDDWNLVDEDHYAALLVWVPLADANAENGGMTVLRGSHKFMKTFRGPDMPSPFKKLFPHIWKNLENLSISAGEAMIFYFNILHASPANLTNQIRLAALCAIVPEKAELRYYTWNGRQVEEYESNMDFYFKNDPTKGPKGVKMLRSIDYDCPKLSIRQFDEMFLRGASYEQVASWKESEGPDNLITVGQAGQNAALTLTEPQKEPLDTGSAQNLLRKISGFFFRKQC
jgi:hypothetical protein